MTTTIPDVPIPAGAAKTDEWQDDAPLPYRVLSGELRNTGGSSSRPSRPPLCSSPMGGLMTAACMRTAAR
jgi:hypothetical protein